MMEAAQGPADGEAYVRRCLTMEYAETAENRTFASDPAFADVLTALNTQRYAEAIASGQELLPRFADFDLPYKWVASAYRATQQWPSARSVLLTGLTRSCLLYTSDAADDLPCVDLGGRRLIKKKQTHKSHPICTTHTH